MKFLCRRFIFCLNECQSRLFLLECKFSRVNLEYLRVPSFLSKQGCLYMGIHGRFLSETFIWLNNLSPLCQAKCQSLSCVQLFATPWTIANQTPLSMEFSRKEYQNGFTFPSPGDLSNPGIEPMSPTLQAGSLLSEPPGKSLTPIYRVHLVI